MIRYAVAAMVSWVGVLTVASATQTGSGITMDRALNAARAAVQQCRSDGYRVSAAVVDRSGVILAQLRATDAGVHTIDSSRKKAYTAASLGVPTGQLAAMMAKNPEIEGLRDMNDEILILGGGLPVKIDGRVVGGIGVGGAPGSSYDEACARAGLDTLVGKQTDRPAGDH
ncbi:MAG TPA: heme-binding protein [Gammaproteobacteria bacterium]|nr:heme-binding protein [Gammaproteobacteria bacterium]